MGTAKQIQRFAEKISCQLRRRVIAERLRELLANMARNQFFFGRRNGKLSLAKKPTLGILNVTRILFQMGEDIFFLTKLLPRHSTCGGRR
jgi:hypothetical protein